MTEADLLTLDVDLSKAIQIQGWMSEPELHWLATQAKQHQRIVELGSFVGRSTRALADNTPGVVFAIDDWQGPRGDNFCGDGTENLSGKMEGTEERFKMNLRDLLGLKVISIKLDHAKADKIDFFYGRPDMVFIDGDHTYEAVSRDIKIWRRKLAVGGLLCGHDFPWPGVSKAVKELCRKWAQVPATDIWFTYD